LAGTRRAVTCGLDPNADWPVPADIDCHAIRDTRADSHDHALKHVDLDTIVPFKHPIPGGSHSSDWA